MAAGRQAQSRAIDAHEHNHAQYWKSGAQEPGLEAQEEVCVYPVRLSRLPSCFSLGYIKRKEETERVQRENQVNKAYTHKSDATHVLYRPF